MGSVPRRESERRRRNPVDPARVDRVLPAGGRRGRPPNPPVPLGAAGRALWGRLWGSPQATLWTRAHLDGVAKRCQLEDLAADPDVSTGDAVKVLGAIQAWDDRWGFNPRALAQLHLIIEGETPAPAEEPRTEVVDIRDRLKGITGTQ